MTRIGRPRLPWHFWAIAVVSLLWNAGGIASYLATETNNLTIAGVPSELHSYFYGFPAWAVAFWALGVWGAFLGSVLLLFRSRWAVWSFAISLIGVAGTTVYERFMTDMPAALQTPGQTVFALAIWSVTTFLLIYSVSYRQKGILT